MWELEDADAPKKTEDQQKRLVELNGTAQQAGQIQKLRKEVQDLWEKVEGLTDVEDVEETEETENGGVGDDDVDSLIAEVEEENGT